MPESKEIKMKKLLKVMPIAVAMFSLASCGGNQTSSVATSSSTPTSVATSSTTPTPTSSSTTPTPTPTSTTPAAKVVTKTVDMASIPGKSKSDADWTLADGFFTCHQVSSDANTDIKTDGTSDKDLKASIQFTTTGAGKVTMTAKSGGKGNGSQGSYRKLFLVKLNSEGTAIDKFIQDSKVGLDYGDLEWDFYSAGKYAILSDSSCKISALSVTYTEGATSTEPTYSIPTASDASIFEPINIRPGTYSSATYGQFKLTGDVFFKGARTITGITNQFDNYLTINGQDNDKPGKFTLNNSNGEAGTLTIYAAESAELGTVKVGHKSNSGDISYEETPIQKDSNKVLAPISISVAATDTTVDVICDTGAINIFYATFQAI